MVPTNIDTRSAYGFIIIIVLIPIHFFRFPAQLPTSLSWSLYLFIIIFIYHRFFIFCSSPLFVGRSCIPHESLILPTAFLCNRPLRNTLTCSFFFYGPRSLFPVNVNLYIHLCIALIFFQFSFVISVTINLMICYLVA